MKKYFLSVSFVNDKELKLYLNTIQDVERILNTYAHIIYDYDYKLVDYKGGMENVK